MELLQLETGLESCPLHHDFRILGPLCTRSWLRSFWERLSWFKISISLNYPATPLLRQQDTAVIHIAVRRGLRGTKLRSFQCCRQANCILFLSDMTTADGRHLDKTYLGPIPWCSKNSTYNFPEERPSVQDWAVWASFWRNYCGRDLLLPRRLGDWISPSHRIWRWFHDAESGRIEWVDGDTVWYFERACTRGPPHERTRHLCLQGLFSGRIPTNWTTMLGGPPRRWPRRFSAMCRANVGKTWFNFLWLL
jgi:hypothetical protein